MSDEVMPSTSFTYVRPCIPICRFMFGCTCMFTGEGSAVRPTVVVVIPVQNTEDGARRRCSLWPLCKKPGYIQTALQVNGQPEQ